MESSDTEDYLLSDVNVTSDDDFIKSKRDEQQNERGRKRVQHPELWSRNIAKRRRCQVGVFISLFSVDYYIILQIAILCYSTNAII